MVVSLQREATNTAAGCELRSDVQGKEGFAQKVSQADIQGAETFPGQGSAWLRGRIRLGVFEPQQGDPGVAGGRERGGQNWRGAGRRPGWGMAP